MFGCNQGEPVITSTLRANNCSKLRLLPEKLWTCHACVFPLCAVLSSDELEIFERRFTFLESESQIASSLEVSQNHCWMVVTITV